MTNTDTRATARDPELSAQSDLVEVLALLVNETRYLKLEVDALRHEVGALRVAHYVAMELILIHGSGLTPEAAHEVMDEIFHEGEQA